MPAEHLNAGSSPVAYFMKIAIVGHEAAKFTLEMAQKANDIIAGLIGHLMDPDDFVVSGHCHLGGIDIWAEEMATQLGIGKMIFPPAKLEWSGGYRERNIQIAKACDVIHNIVVAEYPPNYKGMVFKGCYHCVKRPNRSHGEHIKSGGCWTAWLAHEKFGKPAYWHII